MADEVRVGRRAIVVPEDKRSELIRRLKAAGYQHSATDLERFSPSHHQGRQAARALSPRGLRFEVVGVDAFGSELAELTEALREDVRTDRASLDPPGQAT